MARILSTEQAKKMAASVIHRNGGRHKRIEEEALNKILDSELSLKDGFALLKSFVSAPIVNDANLRALLTFIAYRIGKPIERKEVKIGGGLEIEIKSRAKEYQELFDKFISEEEGDLGDDGSAEPMDPAQADDQTDPLSDSN